MKKNWLVWKRRQTSLTHQRWFQLLLAILLTIGIFFHFFNLDKKLYWHDEAYTSMRAAGYTRTELDRDLFPDSLLSVEDLQKAQQIKPGSTFKDTINSLVIEDPQHPPLYFLMARFWMQSFGSSLTASRTLPVLISLLSLPLIYLLSLELFSSKLAAILATIFLALSPCDILFAQTARQYSLLTLTVIASSLVLLKALKISNWKTWSLYTVVCTVGFYTHPFFILTLIGHTVFLLGVWLFDKLEIKKILSFGLAIAATAILYSPWIFVLTTNYQRALNTTDWARLRVELSYLIKLWTLSFTSLFVDLDFGFDNIQTYAIRFPFVLLILFSAYAVCRQTKRSTWLFIITAIFVPFLLLALPDLISGGKRSAVTRYLLPSFPGVQLAVGYLMARLLIKEKQFGRIIFAAIMSVTIYSCTLNALADTSWSKDLSFHNWEVARAINASSSPLLISDRGDDWTNLGDLLSLGYILDPDVRLTLFSYPTNPEKVREILAENQSEVFVFRPSTKLFSAIEKAGGKLETVSVQGRLLKLSSQS
ncbi:MAG: glycosyltransferase family 39 protein [Hydrococcus sp. C42_A2020_068]|nr:glycosyltransferase family 39 protein [Hydrococcus sp. C42_A2020_068]